MLEVGRYKCVYKKYPNDPFDIIIDWVLWDRDRARITLPNGSCVIDQCGWSKIWYISEFLNICRII